MKLIHNNKRKLLKAGIAAFPLYGLPKFCHAQSQQISTSSLFAILGKRPWLAAIPRAAARTLPAPPIPGNIGRPSNNPILFWVNTNLELIRKYRLNPLRAARTLSYLTVAIHDAVLSSIATFGNSPSHSAIAVHFAAGSVLEYLFPEESRGHWIGEGIMSASPYALPSASDWNKLWDLSQQISEQVIVRALTDGSARINALAQPPKTIRLAWKAAPPLWSTRPVEPGAPGWKPWLVSSAIGEQCAPPAALHEDSYLKEIQEVYRTHQNLTPEKKRIAEAWDLDLGTVTPPGVWVLKAIKEKAFLRLKLIEQTGLLSLLSTTMMDAFTACWYVKFKWWTERPVTAIRRLYDPDFLPHILTPSFPSYTSGHATVSGAAANILSNLLPQFKEAWQTAAQEAADSRLYGGIHFRSDNEEGLALGRKVGHSAILEIQKYT